MTKSAATKIVRSPSSSRLSELVTEAKCSRKKVGPAWSYSVPGLHVVKLAGTQYDMGRQHGELLKQVIPNGPMNYFRDYLRRVLRQSQLGPAGDLAWFAVKNGLSRRVAKSLPDYALDALKGLADGSGIPYNHILEGAVMPDSFMWLAARMIEFKRCDPAVAHRLALGLGCTSAIAWGNSTRDGMMLHARNLDYHAVSCWPKSAAVIFSEPKDGHRYVSVTAAGIAMGGITAMNDAGLTLTVHQHMFTNGTRLGGTAIGAVGDQVMREASTLAQAEDILRRYTPIGAWTYLIASAHEKQLLCFEENPDYQRAIYTSSDDETFGYANIYLDDDLGDSERCLYGSYWRANLGRHRRVNQILKERCGTLDATAMAGIMGDVNPESCRLSDAIAMLMTTSTVVFRPDDGMLWVGSGEAPTSHSEFLPFSLRDEDIATDEQTLTAHMPEGPGVVAFGKYRDAYLQYFEHGNLASARRLMADACSLAPTEPLYHFLNGLTALQAVDTRAATASMSRSIELSHPHEARRGAFHLWRGRAHDLAGDRHSAVADYRRVLGHKVDQTVLIAARRGLKRRYNARTAAKLSIDFAMADVVDP